MDYKQEVVWVGTVLGDSSVEDFEEFFLKELGFHVKYVEEYGMTGEYDGIHCIIFRIASEDLSRFTMFRLQTPDMKWIEDFWDNETENIPCEIYEKYN